jgi:ubiquinone/menaquinone biosynthesis C-methylase UbiE
MSNLQTQNAVSIFNKYAKQYHERFRDVSLYTTSLELFCNYVKEKDAEILELACGPGNLTKFILSKRRDFKVLGTDLAPNMLAIAELINPTARFLELDCRDILTLNKKFNGLVCGFCLPYLSMQECDNLFKDIYSILYPSGVLYISTMEENEKSKSGIQTTSAGEQMFLYYHQGDLLRKSLEENGFLVMNEERKKYVDHHGNHTTDLLIVAGRNNN